MLDELSVNLLDPKEVREKMPEVKAALDAARGLLADLEAQVELLSRIVGEKPPSSGGAPRRVTYRARPRQTKPAPSQERVVKALTKADRPMSPTTLHRFMEATDGIEPFKDVSALNSVLWAAAKAGRIVKAPNGVYAPPGFPTDRPLTDYDAAAANGMPVPSHLPGVNGSAPPEAAQQTSSDDDGRRFEGQELSGEVASR